MKRPPYFMVFDVESIGLHGEGFAWGYVVVNAHGQVVREAQAACSPNKACGNAADHLWVAENVPKLEDTHDSPRLVRDAFWQEWLGWSNYGAVLVADVAWPVESRFLAACIDDDPTRRHWEGPYPLHELTSIALALGADIKGLWGVRSETELPAHDPLKDARLSSLILARLLQLGAPGVQAQLGPEVT